MRRTLPFLALAVAALGAAGGCTLDEAPPERQEARPQAEGASPEDTAMARQVVRYLDRNAREWPWYRRVEAVAVDGGVVTIETTLDLEASPDAGLLACTFIQGSDVADFTPGHRVTGRHGTQVACQHRRS